MRAIHLLLVATLGTFVPAIARAQTLDERFELGEKLGSGSFKNVFAVKDHPGLVIGIQHASTFREFTPEKMKTILTDEKALVDRLAEAGTPTATILEIGTYKGDRAYLQKRFATGNRAPDWETTKWTVLNETSLEDVRKIRATLVAAQLDVDDAQFLVGEDGHVVVADPLAVREGRTKPERLNQALHGIESDAEQAIAKRRIDVLKAIPSARDPRFASYFETTRVAAYGDEGRARLHEALLQFLESAGTTAAARDVAVAVRSGTLEVRLLEHGTVVRLDEAKNQVTLWLDQTFPKLASDLVREGIGRIHGAETLLEREVAAAAHAIDFLRAREVPHEAVRPGDGEPELPRDPAALVKRLAGERALSPAEHERLVASARAILTRGEPRSKGVAGVLGERLREARETRAEER